MAAQSLLRRDHEQNPVWKYAILTQVFCTTIAGVLFLLRCYVRLGFSTLCRQWTLEDWIVTFSFLGLLCFSVLLTLSANHHLGVHIQYLTSEQLAEAQWFFWLSTIIYGPIALTIKIAILLISRRIFENARWSIRWCSIHCLGTICVVYYIPNTFVRFFACRPMEKSWNAAVPGHCTNTSLGTLINGVFDIVSDLILLLIPTLSVGKLHFSLRKKISVVAVLAVGAIAPIVSIIGLAFILKAMDSVDKPFIYLELLFFAVAELTIGVICACLPILSPLFIKSRCTKDAETSGALHASSQPQPQAGAGALSELAYQRSSQVDQAPRHMQPATGFKQTGPRMRAREEVNVFNNKGGKASSMGSQGQGTDLLDFLAEAGRIDGPPGKGVV